MQEIVSMLTGGQTDRPGDKPSVAYWHLWTDDDGISHQDRCELTEYTLKGVGDAAPQWIVPMSGR